MMVRSGQGGEFFEGYRHRHPTEHQAFNGVLQTAAIRRRSVARGVGDSRSRQTGIGSAIPGSMIMTCRVIRHGKSCGPYQKGPLYALAVAAAARWPNSFRMAPMFGARTAAWIYFRYIFRRLSPPRSGRDRQPNARECMILRADSTAAILRRPALVAFHRTEQARSGCFVERFNCPFTTNASTARCPQRSPMPTAPYWNKGYDRHRLRHILGNLTSARFGTQKSTLESRSLEKKDACFSRPREISDSDEEGHHRHKSCLWRIGLRSVATT